MSQNSEVWDERSADCRRLQHERKSSRQFSPIQTPTIILYHHPLQASTLGQTIQTMLWTFAWWCSQKQFPNPLIFSICRHNTAADENYVFSESFFLLLFFNSLMVADHIGYCTVRPGQPKATILLSVCLSQMWRKIKEKENTHIIKYLVVGLNKPLLLPFPRNSIHGHWLLWHNTNWDNITFYLCVSETNALVTYKLHTTYTKIK